MLCKKALLFFFQIQQKRNGFFALLRMTNRVIANKPQVCVAIRKKGKQKKQKLFFKLLLLQMFFIILRFFCGEGRLFGVLPGRADEVSVL